MSNALAAVQRYALLGLRADVEDIIVRIRDIRQQFPRLTTSSTSIAAMAAMLEEIAELTERDDRPTRPPPRAPSATSPRDAAPAVAASDSGRRARVRRASKRKLAGAALSGAKRRWDVARPTLTVLSMTPEGLTIGEAADKLNRLRTEDEDEVTPGAARWRLNQLVKRGQADLARENPPLYQITKLGVQCVNSDKDIEE